MSYKKKFDLVDLESKLSQYYSEYDRNPNNKTRTNLYVGLRDLAYATLCTSKYTKEIRDYEDMAHDYATYMFERIITGNFKPTPKTEGSNRFPWNQYIRLNIKATVYNRNIEDKNSLNDWVSDINFVLDTTVIRQLSGDCSKLYPNGSNVSGLDTNNIIDSFYYNEFILDKCIIDNDIEFSKKKLAFLLYKSLTTFYTPEEIKRYYPVSLEYLEKRRFMYADTDIKDFCITLISLAKRLLAVYTKNDMRAEMVCIKNFDKLLKGSLRSSLFLFTIANTNIVPKELLFALDTDSLYRLCSIAGGTKIEIPKISDFETLIGAVLTVSKQIEEGKPFLQSRDEVKRDYRLMFKKNFNFEDLVKFISHNYSMLNEEGGIETVSSLLVKSMTAVNEYLDYINKNTDKISRNEVLGLYSELNNSMSMLTSFTMNLNKILKNKLDNVK